MADGVIGVGVVLLNDKREVLLGIRQAAPGIGEWALPGGKTEPGESIEECAARGLFEETAMAGKNGEFICRFYLAGVDHDTAGFWFKDFTGEPIVTEPDKMTEWSWWPLDALPNPLFEHSRKILEEF